MKKNERERNDLAGLFLFLYSASRPVLLKKKSLGDMCLQGSGWARCVIGELLSFIGGNDLVIDQTRNFDTQNVLQLHNEESNPYADVGDKHQPVVINRMLVLFW